MRNHQNKMIRKKDYSSLAKSYNAFSYENQLKELLFNFLKTEKYNNLNKFQLAKTINDIVFKHYNGEQILKYKLANEFRKKDYIAAFEVRVKSSRTDFLVINGETKSFEVKSKIDTLSRLKKQIDDYGDVFEFNNVVIDEIHLKKVLNLIPEHYGIWFYEGNKKIIYKEAQYSPNISPREQITLLNKKELSKAFCITSIDGILERFDPDLINLIVKTSLKQRYSERWQFVLNNWNNILPIDIQFFFNTNLQPSLIYEL